MEKNQSNFREAARARKKTKIFIKIFYWFCLLAFIGATGYVLFFSPFLNINEINVSGTESIDPGLIREEIFADLSGNYFKYLNKSNIILFGSGSISGDILDKFKNIKSISFKRIFPNKLDVLIVERKAALILCSGDSCYVLDEKGVAFKNTSRESMDFNENELLILNNGNNDQVSIGKEALDPSYISYISELNDKIKNEMDFYLEREFNVSQIVSGDIFAKTSEGWTLEFSKNINVNKEIEMLKVVLDGKIPRDKRTGLEYIDLRIDNKVFYKFINSNQDVQNPPTENTQPPAEIKKEDSKDKDKKKKG